MCLFCWFLDPGGWSKTAAAGLYFIFPGICTLSLIYLFSLVVPLEGQKKDSDPLELELQMVVNHRVGAGN
ncbi:hypothetical protein STEG23_013272 [Scotinomys teguina]